MLNDVSSRVYRLPLLAAMTDQKKATTTPQFWAKIPLEYLQDQSSNGSHVVYSKVFLRCRDEVVIFMLTLKVSPNIRRKKKTHFVMH